MLPRACRVRTDITACTPPKWLSSSAVIFRVQRANDLTSLPVNLWWQKFSTDRITFPARARRLFNVQSIDHRMMGGNRERKVVLKWSRTTKATIWLIINPCHAYACTSRLLCPLPVDCHCRPLYYSMHICWIRMVSDHHYHIWLNTRVCKISSVCWWCYFICRRDCFLWMNMSAHVFGKST